VVDRTCNAKNVEESLSLFSFSRLKRERKALGFLAFSENNVYVLTCRHDLSLNDY
jgi:hypothetical protein